MDIKKANRVANKYLIMFEKMEYEKFSFGDFQIDLDRAGFVCDYRKSFNKFYPGGVWSNEPEKIESIMDIQTVGNTIYYMIRKILHGGWCTTLEERDWFIHALRHLKELTDKELSK